MKLFYEIFITNPVCIRQHEQTCYNVIKSNLNHQGLSNSFSIRLIRLYEIIIDVLLLK